MGKFTSQARQLRLELQVKMGRSVSIREVAEAIGVDRRVVMKIENGTMERVHLDSLERLGAFYHSHGLDASRILQYDPEAILTPVPVGALIGA